MKFLSLACALAAVLLLALVSTIWFLRTSGLSPDQMWARIEIAREVFYVPSGYARRPGDLRHRYHEEFELVAVLPEFRPVMHGAVPSEMIISISLRAADLRHHPVERPARLYARFLGLEEQKIGAGLVWRNFVWGTPYEGEAVAMTPPDGRLFWARCRPASLERRMQSICIGEIRIGHLDVSFRINGTRLADWQRIVEGLRVFLEQLARPPDKLQNEENFDF